MLLIQGFFFFKGHQPEIGYDGDGAKVLVHEVMQYSMFAGVIGSEQKRSKMLFGRMNDHFGDSVLANIKTRDGTFCFTKLYDHRTDAVHYQFKKNPDGTWSGTFRGKATGSGQACCILTIVPESFLLPPVKVVKPAKKLKL